MILSSHSSHSRRPASVRGDGWTERYKNESRQFPIHLRDGWTGWTGGTERHKNQQQQRSTDG